MKVNIKETYSFDEFLEKLENKEQINKEINSLFDDEDEKIELRVRDGRRVVYLLSLKRATPTMDVEIPICKHAQATFEPIEGTFKLEKTLATILKQQQKDAHQILDDMNEEYLDTY